MHPFQINGQRLSQEFTKLPSPLLFKEHYSKIAEPLTMADIRRRIEAYRYKSSQELMRDFMTMFGNARSYYPPGSQIMCDANLLEQVAAEAMSRVSNGRAFGRPPFRATKRNRITPAPASGWANVILCKIENSILAKTTFVLIYEHKFSSIHHKHRRMELVDQQRKSEPELPTPKLRTHLTAKADPRGVASRINRKHRRAKLAIHQRRSEHALLMLKVPLDLSTARPARTRLLQLQQAMRLTKQKPTKT